MKISEQWLREWVSLDIDVHQLASQLTTAGLEVDSVEPVIAQAVRGIVTARVVEVAAHPDADRLRICQVDAGTGCLLNVVCGAPNVRAGMAVPFAPIGARVVGGKKIKASKIRGQASQGMLCSPIEIGLGDDADGLLELADEIVPGEALETHLALNDNTIDVDLTPNRGDCLSHIGIAREVSVINRVAMKPVKVDPIAPVVDDTFGVELLEPEACPRYAGRIIRGIDPDRQTPMWMRERLRRCGLRAISPVVDVTNIVMLELGQPLHGFDFDKLEGGIRVRKANANERLVLLDNQELELDREMLVIADHHKALALAGIMGGLDSAVTEATVNIFFEAAFFEPRHVAGDARRYGLHTDASHRFERGVDPEHPVRAIERATQLLLEIAGGEPGPIVDVCSLDHMPKRPVVELRESRLVRLLGTNFDQDEVSSLLKRLGLQVSSTKQGWSVVPPGFRFDISIEADLIEEVARITGYNNLPTKLPRGDLAMPRVAEALVTTNALRHVLCKRGYREAITYSFVDDATQQLFGTGDAIALSNPIASDLAVMRTSLWPGLVQAAQHNLHRQQSVIRLFESGLVFRKNGADIEQIPRLAGLICGTKVPIQWAADAENVDFFDLKGDVQALLELGELARLGQYVADSHPALHPGQCARLVNDSHSIGFLGLMQPSINRSLKIESEIFLFELDLRALQAGIVPKFKALSKYPSVRRDLSIVVEEGVSAQSVWDCVGQRRIDVLKNLELFDVYRGEGIDSGKKSFTLSLTFQSSKRTLNDEEIELLISGVVDTLESELGSTLRG